MLEGIVENTVAVEVHFTAVGVSTAETKCAKWRRESVPVELREKGREALAS